MKDSGRSQRTTVKKTYQQGWGWCIMERMKLSQKNRRDKTSTAEPSLRGFSQQPKYKERNVGSRSQLWKEHDSSPSHWLRVARSLTRRRQAECCLLFLGFAARKSTRIQFSVFLVSWISMYRRTISLTTLYFLYIYSGNKRNFNVLVRNFRGRRTIG